jgi:hypothetical protein
MDIRLLTAESSPCRCVNPQTMTWPPGIRSETDSDPTLRLSLRPALNLFALPLRKDYLRARGAGGPLNKQAVLEFLRDPNSHLEEHYAAYFANRIRHGMNGRNPQVARSNAPLLPDEEDMKTSRAALPIERKIFDLSTINDPLLKDAVKDYLLSEGVKRRYQKSIGDLPLEDGGDIDVDALGANDRLRGVIDAILAELNAAVRMNTGVPSNVPAIPMVQSSESPYTLIPLSSLRYSIVDAAALHQHH